MLKSYAAYSHYYINNKKNRVSYIDVNMCNKLNNFAQNITLFCVKKLKNTCSQAKNVNKLRISIFLRKLGSFLAIFVLIHKDFVRISVNNFFDENLNEVSIK